MNKLFKKFIYSTIALIVSFALATPVYACTGVIVGSDVSEDGNYIFGRTEDLEVNHNKIFTVHPAGQYKANDLIKDVSYDEELGYEFTFTHDSYAYTSVSDTTPEYGIFDEAGFNEKGLIADMTVSASANDAVLEADPYLDGSVEGENIGIAEAIITTVVLSSASNAREAVELVANEVALKGAAEGNGFVVGDNKELWYVEVYTGHQFVAMKYPADKFSVFPNTFWINEVVLDEGEITDNFIVSKDGNFIYSKDIFKIAKEANTFVGDEATFTIDLAKSYGPEELSDGNRSRVCSGILHLNEAANVNMESESYDFLQEAGSKITLQDVLTFTQNRMENVNIEADDLGKNLAYPIGNRNTMEAHIFHLNKDNDSTYPGVMWLALGSPLVSPFVAYYPNQTGSIKEAMNPTNEFAEDSVYWMAMDILHMVELNREEFMKVVEKHLTPLQSELLANENTKVLSAEEATKANEEDATQAFEAMKALREELLPMYKEYLANNEYNVRFNARRKTAGFAGTNITVSPNAAETKLLLTINPEEKVLSLVDVYGNPIEKLNSSIKYQITKTAFEGTPAFLNGETPIELTDSGEFYEFESDATVITYSMEESAEAPAEAEQTSEPSNNKFSFLTVGAIIAVLALSVFARKKVK